MKKLAILLTLVMLVSSVSVFAAPQINYMFYDENDDIYYAFGQYNNPDAGTNYKSIPDNVGVFLGDDFSTEYDLRTAQLNASIVKNPGYFGIGFGKGYSEEIKENGFKVTPFAKYDYLNTILGDEIVMDATAEYGIAKSSNADLAELTFVRKTSTGGDSVVLVPAFSPDVTNYQAYSSYAFSSHTYIYKPANSKATVESTLDGNALTIKVTAEDGVTSKTYIINYTQDNKFATNNAVSALYSASHKFKASGDYASTTKGNQQDILSFSNSSGNKAYATCTFSLTDANKNALASASNIVLDLEIGENDNTDKIKNYTFGVYGVESGVSVSGTTVTHTPEQFTFTEDPVGSVTVPRIGLADTLTYEYGIDVTEYIKESIAAGKSDITLAVTLDGADYIEAVGDNEIVFKAYNTTMTKNRNPRLLYK